MDGLYSIQVSVFHKLNLPMCAYLQNFWIEIRAHWEIEFRLFSHQKCQKCLTLFDEKWFGWRTSIFAKKEVGKTKKKQNKTHKFLRKRMSTLTWEYILSKFPKTNDGTFEFRRQKIENKWSYYLRLLAVKNCSLLIPSQSPNLLGINRNISKA